MIAARMAAAAALALAAAAHAQAPAPSPAPSPAPAAPSAGATAPKAPTSTPAPGGKPLSNAMPSPPTAANPLAPFGWFADLSGSCWRGEYPDKASSDTQCYLSQYGALMRGSIKGEYTQAGIPRTTFEGDAVFAWDAQKGRILFTQWGTGNTYGTGEIVVEGDAFVFRNFLSDGTAASVRSVWRRTGPDSFRVVRERKLEDAWREFLAVDYQRVR